MATCIGESMLLNSPAPSKLRRCLRAPQGRGLLLGEPLCTILAGLPPDADQLLERRGLLVLQRTWNIVHQAIPRDVHRKSYAKAVLRGLQSKPGTSAAGT
uniref:Uncharacterized protein n=1 Tax=Alexandrium andersonii TaxID=327968 RepID=A0A7S2J2Y7_9DINO